MARDGGAGPRSVAWTSHHDRLAVSGSGISTVDRLDEAGLVANRLRLADAECLPDDGTAPRMSPSFCAQHCLDDCAIVAEAVEDLRARPFDVVAGEVPAMPGRMTAVPLSLSDATGDSAILERVDGELMGHPSREFRAMTNEPRHEEQLGVAPAGTG